MDDNFIRSRKMANFARDLEENLDTLRKVGLKLNLVKCKFGVKSGNFLVHVISYKGLKANPEKT